MSTILGVVGAVEAVKAVSRIPEDLRGRGFTWYSSMDFWVYHAVADNRICQDCRTYAEMEMFAGNDLRHFFPDHKITTIDTIEVRVHINCRCYLTRLIHTQLKT